MQTMRNHQRTVVSCVAISAYSLLGQCFPDFLFNLF